MNRRVIELRHALTSFFNCPESTPYSDVIDVSALLITNHHKGKAVSMYYRPPPTIPTWYIVTNP